MKKLFVLVSCVAAILALNSVSFAQEAVTAEPVAPCTCAYCTGASSVTLPLTYPGLSINPRDVRRAARFDARVATRQTRLEYRFAAPVAQAYPFQIPAEAAAGSPGVAAEGLPGFMAGSVGQTGRINTSIQRGSSSPVVNFMSIVRPSRLDAPYYYPAQPQ